MNSYGKVSRVLANVILFEGKEYPLHIAESDGQGHIRVYPFEKEVHSTVFMPGKVAISTDKDGNMVAVPVV